MSADSTAVNTPSSLEGLRQRQGASETTTGNTTSTSTPTPAQEPEKAGSQKGAVLGRTPDGRLFHVQETPDMLSSIFRPDLPKTPLDYVTIVSLTVQVVLFFTLSRSTARIFFMLYFAFWRISYNGGLGYLLVQQSTTRWIVRLVEREGWMDPKRSPRISAWIQQQLQTKMGKQYKFEVCGATNAGNAD